MNSQAENPNTRPRWNQRAAILALGFALLLGLPLLTAAGAAPGPAAPAQAQATVTPLALPTAAPVDTCETRLPAFYTDATASCLDTISANTICNGGAAPQVIPAGPVANSLAAAGATVPVGVVDAITGAPFNAEGTSGGIVYLRVQETGMNALLLGEVNVQDMIEPDAGFPAWTALQVVTAGPPSGCFAAPRNALVMQNEALLTPIRVVVNSASLDIEGTVLVYTEGTQTVFVVIEGIVRVLAAGEAQTLVAGQSTRVNYAEGDWSFPLAGPLLPAPYSPGVTDNMPVEMLDRVVVLPQPGFVATGAPVNLRTGPGTEYGIIYQVPAGQTMTILGRNPAGDWYHVRLLDGTTGWMFAELLRRNHGAIAAVYQSTPLPPQRYGDAGRLAYTLSEVTMRSAPHVGFEPIYPLRGGTELEVVARSPYSPWVRVQAEGATGWVPLLNLDTRVVVQSLPVDYSVPLPPEPTEIPGLSGFAFPDPSCFPDC